jgi:hypothetical protein
MYGSRLIAVPDRWRFADAIKVELNLTKKIILYSFCKTSLQTSQPITGPYACAKHAMQMGG